MKKLVLSNGVEINAYVGDGFDGASGIRVTGPLKGSKRRMEGEFAVPVSDRAAVIALLEWYRDEEMELRREEGAIHVYDEPKTIESFESPYQAEWFIGALRGRDGKLV